MWVRVPGTRVQLIPPEGFRPSAQFHGFENEVSEASIGVTELPTPMDELRQGLEGEVIDIDGRPALLVEAEQVVFGGSITKVMVVIGDDQRSVVIVGTAPTESGLAEVLRNALLSARWTPDEAPPNDDLPYRFTECPPLRVATRMGHVVLLTEEGTVGLTAAATMMTIGVVPVDADRDLAEVSADHLSSLPGLEGVAATSAEDVVLASGVAAFEFVAEGLSAGDALPIRVYQLVARFGDQEVIAVGRASAERFDTMVAAFRAVGRSVG